MAATRANVIVLIREVYNKMDSANRDSDIDRFIVDADSFVTNEVGSTQSGTLVDYTIELVAAMLAVQQISGGSSAGPSFKLGDLSVDKSSIGEFQPAYDQLKFMLDRNLVSLGTDLRFDVVNS